MAWLLPSIGLLAVGRFRPAATVLIAAPLAAVLFITALRRPPGRWPGPVRPRPARLDSARLDPASPDRGRRPARAWTVWWGLAGTVAIAAGFGAWQVLLNSPQIIVLRDPGALFQYGYWIAGHGALPIPRSVTAFGGPHPGLAFASSGFVARSAGLSPQFMPGLPVLLAAGWWLHGLPAAALVSPVLGAFAVLSFGGLAGLPAAAAGPVGRAGPRAQPARAVHQPVRVQ